MRRTERSASKGKCAQGETHVYCFADVSVNIDAMEVTRTGTRVNLTAQEFRVLRYFIDRANRVISREELLNEVWGYHNYPSTRTVDNHILRLRHKLEADPSNPRHFLTLHGAGYKFVPETAQELAAG
jgi:DNA-binding response OmpR family regulator